MLILLAIVLIIAVREDLATGRIPNRLTLGATLLALVLAFALGGSAGIKDHFMGAAITGAIWLALWLGGMMGGGDQKLMMAVGALVGRDLALPVVFAVAIAGGLQALLWLWMPRPPHSGVFGTYSDTSGVMTRLRTTRIPYSIAIALGTVTALLFDRWGIIYQLGLPI